MKILPFRDNLHCVLLQISWDRQVRDADFFAESLACPDWKSSMEWQLAMPLAALPRILCLDPTHQASHTSHRFCRSDRSSKDLLNSCNLRPDTRCNCLRATHATTSNSPVTPYSDAMIKSLIHCITLEDEVRCLSFSCIVLHLCTDCYLLLSEDLFCWRSVHNGQTSSC